MPATTQRNARRRPDARSRLIVAAVVASLMAAFAVSVPASALPTCRIGDTLTKHRKYTDWHRSVLDTYYKLPSTYAPSGRTNTSAAGLTSGFYVRTIIIADLKAMASAARSAGARLAVQSAYRSYANQKATFDYWVRVDGYATAIKESARAGHSEHQLGTTLDFRSYSGGAPWNYSDWATTKAGAWLKANAWKYGFIMSYPKGKSALTCYAYEPWHYRYVGRDVAAKVRASGLTLREYLWKQQTATPPPPTPTPTPNPSPTPDPTPTPTPTPDPTPTPTPEEAPREAPGAEAAPEAAPDAPGPIPDAPPVGQPSADPATEGG
jgi:D-alanyl-D-alanine carboxypeptidase